MIKLHRIYENNNHIIFLSWRGKVNGRDIEVTTDKQYLRNIGNLKNQYQIHIESINTVLRESTI